MKLIYLGSGEFGIESLNALAASQQDLALVVTQAPHPAGRGRKPRSTPVARWAKDHSVEFIEVEDANTPEQIARIAQYQPDLIVVIAFGQKISNELMNLPPKGAINVHASLLPKYRGAAPINWAIINGETKTGVSIITLDEKMDAGLVLGQAKIDITPDETAGQLHDKLARIAPPLLIDKINKIAAGTAQYTEQDHAKVTQAPKLKKQNGFIDFTEPADSLERKIRGFSPWPGASAIYASKETGKQQRVLIAMAQVVETDNPAGLPAGVLDDNLNIICGQNALHITKIKPADGALMPFKDFVNGRQTHPGDKFTKIED